MCLSYAYKCHNTAPAVNKHSISVSTRNQGIIGEHKVLVTLQDYKKRFARKNSQNMSSKMKLPNKGIHYKYSRLHHLFVILLTTTLDSSSQL